MKHTLRFLDKNENFDKNVRNQIESTLKSVNRKEVDLSKLDILSFDSEVIKSIKILFKNLISIKRRSMIAAKFKQFMTKTTGSDDIASFRIYFNEIKKYKNLKIFKENSMKALFVGKIYFLLKGDTFVKINFTSQGKVEHFYKINESDKSLLVHNSKISKSSSKFYFEKDIIQVKYGVKSKNLIKKYKDFKTKLHKPWLYLSFIMKKSSIDLFMKEEQIVCWFFGLNEMISQNVKLKEGLGREMKIVFSSMGFQPMKTIFCILKKIKFISKFNSHFICKIP